MRTDARGRYRFEAAPLGPVNVRAFKPGYDLVQRSLWLGGDARVDLTATRGRGATLHMSIAGLEAGEHESVSKPSEIMPRRAVQ